MYKAPEGYSSVVFSPGSQNRLRREVLELSTVKGSGSMWLIGAKYNGSQGSQGRYSDANWEDAILWQLGKQEWEWRKRQRWGISKKKPLDKRGLSRHKCWLLRLSLVPFDSTKPLARQRQECETRVWAPLTLIVGYCWILMAKISWFVLHHNVGKVMILRVSQSSFRHTTVTRHENVPVPLHKVY